MKDLNDVVSYLNNVLGHSHDLTIAARKELEKNNTNNELMQSDAGQVILFVLSGMIYQAVDGTVKWDLEQLPETTQKHIHNFFGLDEIVFELQLDEKYPEESNELIQLSNDVDNMINNKEQFEKLVQRIEIDCVRDVLISIDRF